MEVNGLLSLKDFEGIYVDPTLSGFKKLLLVVQVGTSKYEAQEKEEKMYKRKEANHNRMMRSNKRRKLVMATLPMPPSDLPEEFKERIKALGGSGIQVDSVIQKALYKSDLRQNNNRLSMPFKQMNEGLLRSSNKRQKLVMATLPMPPPDLPKEFKECIKALGGSGTQVDLVIQKALYDSDLRPNNNRLSMPFKQINEGFLREEERKDLAKRKAMIVPFIEPSGKCDEMTLKQWDMPKKTGKTSSTYVLVTHWNKVLQANGLGLKDVVQVWSFRVGPEQKLCLALVVVSRSRGDEGGRDGGEACSGSKC